MPVTVNSEYTKVYEDPSLPAWDSFGLSGRLGFTGHEMLDSVGLIHMNGRVYDPELARFVSADPFIQAPNNSQSFNRYSYVMNNPLSFTDPSGFKVIDPEYGDNDEKDNLDNNENDPQYGQDSDDKNNSKESIEELQNDLAEINEKYFPPSFIDRTLDVIGKIWNLPNTIVGFVVGGVGYIAGTILGTDPFITFNNNAIEFHNIPYMASALTLGNVTVYGPKTTPNDRNRHFSNSPKDHTVGDEEALHTIQGQILGPLYVPAHIIGGIVSMLSSPLKDLNYKVDSWHQNNFMETGPMQGEVF